MRNRMLGLLLIIIGALTIKIVDDATMFIFTLIIGLPMILLKAEILEGDYKNGK